MSTYVLNCRTFGDFGALEKLATFGGSRRNANFINSQNFHHRSYNHFSSLKYGTDNAHQWTHIDISSKASLSTCCIHLRQIDDDEFNFYRATHAKRNFLSALPTVTPPTGFNLDLTDQREFLPFKGKSHVPLNHLQSI